MHRHPPAASPPVFAGLLLDRPRLMGIVNATPDSFSDGGRFVDAAAAIAHGKRLIADGADILDIGGESTRPGSQPTAEADELRRVQPVIDGLRDAGAVLSIDTRKPAVMRAAIRTGCAIVNDVNALQGDGLAVVAGSDAAVILMHMQGEPATMNVAPRYSDVVREVRDFLSARVEACVKAGIAQARIAIDPGIGFGKTPAQNWQLIDRLAELAILGCPIAIGISRKLAPRGIEGKAGRDARETASREAGVLAVRNGAAILRVHDVAAMRAALGAD
ncbi:MAG: dihydropteroate synthase [Alphaproteobacteria bacterium]